MRNIQIKLKTASPLLMVAGIMVLTTVILLTGWYCSGIHTSLMPQQQSHLPWKADIEPDGQPGLTYLELQEESKAIAYKFFLSSEKQYPYTAYNFNFVDANGARKLVDLSGFDSFTLWCLLLQLLHKF